jgi:hypothetical protein
MTKVTPDRRRCLYHDCADYATSTGFARISYVVLDVLDVVGQAFRNEIIEL